MFQRSSDSINSPTQDSAFSAFIQTSYHIPSSSLGSSSAISNQGKFCTICNRSYSDLIIPSVYKCGHTCCADCVQKTIQQGRKSEYQCPYCREISPFCPSKNYSLIEAIIPQNICLYHKSEHLAYCIDHDKILCINCIYEHRIHDWVPAADVKAKEIAEIKEKLILENKVKVSQEIESIEIAIREVEIILEKNNHFNETIAKINSTKDLIINDINNKTNACIQEIENLANIGILKKLKISLEKTLKERQSQKLFMERCESSIKTASILSKLCWSNWLINTCSSDHYVERVKYICPPISGINYNDSIARGSLVYEKNENYYGE